MDDRAKPIPFRVLWTTAALEIFYVGYDHGDGGLARVLQIFTAFRVLTKSLVPVFGYPAAIRVLGYEWLRSKRRKLRPDAQSATTGADCGPKSRSDSV